MTLFEQCKVLVRTTTTDDGLVAHINQLIDTAKRDITLGGVHESWTKDEPTDPIIITTIKAYVASQYFFDVDINISNKWLDVYNRHLTKLHNRSVYKSEKVEAI
jgi:hypothetical protein